MKKFTVLSIETALISYSEFHAVSEFLQYENVKLIMLTDRRRTENVLGNEIINIHDIPIKKSLADYQAKYDFSLFKAIVPDRAFFDYTSFYASTCYSKLNLKQIGTLILPYLAALDYYLSGQCDAFYTGMADAFFPSLGIKLAYHYRKRIICLQVYYWWSRGVLISDQPNQTSSMVEKKFDFYTSNPLLINRNDNNKFFAEKKAQLFPWRPETIKERKQLTLIEHRTSRPISIYNLLFRKFRYFFDPLLIRLFIQFKRDNRIIRPFVLFPLHVAPEAVLLGSDPEMADQFSLIKNISMNLPWGVDLLVKIHPNQILSRGIDFSFLRKCSVLPNVTLISKEVDVRSLYNRAECIAVTVINGTVGFEALMCKKPVFIFGSAIYYVPKLFIRPTNWNDFFQILKSIQLKNYVHDDTALHALLHALRDCAVSIPDDAIPQDKDEYGVLLYVTILKQQMSLFFEE